MKVQNKYNKIRMIIVVIKQLEIKLKGLSEQLKKKKKRAASVPK